MAFTNSPLVNYKIISPNKNIGRTHSIDTVTVHCVVGQTKADSLGYFFQNPSLEASSNYGVGCDGKIGLYVEEKDRSWCTSSSSNDNRAVTIEVASDAYHPYAVTKEAYSALINLLADICKRNNIKSLKWKADPSLIGSPSKQNMTAHRWFANKSCPGDYLYNRMGQIANEVNKKLGSKVQNSSEPKTDMDTIKNVQSWINRCYKYGIEEDGIYGYYTRTAINKALQETLNKVYNAKLEVDGIVGKKTMSKIRNLKNGCSGDLVMILQAYLICNGFSTGGFDGVYGNATEKAVKTYQQENSLVSDGIAGPYTFESLSYKN